MVPTVVMFSWAVGSDSFTMPPDVGLALGGTSVNVHSALQIHYSNYGAEKTTDGSGLELQVTSKLHVISFTSLPCCCCRVITTIHGASLFYTSIPDPLPFIVYGCATVRRAPLRFVSTCTSHACHSPIAVWYLNRSALNVFAHSFCPFPLHRLPHATPPSPPATKPKYEAGIIIGSGFSVFSPAMRIPGGVKNTTLSASCKPKLRGEVTAFAFGMHAHIYGSSIRAELVREGGVVGAPPTVVPFGEEIPYVSTSTLYSCVLNEQV